MRENKSRQKWQPLSQSPCHFCLVLDILSLCVCACLLSFYLVFFFYWQSDSRLSTHLTQTPNIAFLTFDDSRLSNKLETTWDLISVSCSTTSGETELQRTGMTKVFQKSGSLQNTEHRANTGLTFSLYCRDEALSSEDEDLSRSLLPNPT